MTKKKKQHTVNLSITHFGQKVLLQNLNLDKIPDLRQFKKVPKFGIFVRFENQKVGVTVIVPFMDKWENRMKTVRIDEEAKYYTVKDWAASHQPK